MIENGSSFLSSRCYPFVPVVLVLITVAWALWMGSVTPLAVRKQPKNRFILGQGALLTIELARDERDLRNALAIEGDTPDPQVIEQVNRNTQLDCVFIALYTLTTLSAAAMLLGIDSRLLLNVLFIGCILVAVGALCDYAENYNIFQMLRAARAGTLSDTLAVSIHRPSLVKWGTLGAGWLLIGLASLLGARFLDTRSKTAVAGVLGLLMLILGADSLNRTWAWLHLPNAKF